MENRTIELYTQFRGRTGSVGQDALTALHLARAKAYGESQGWEWAWEDETEPDLSWCDECEREKCRDHYHEVFCLVLRDATGDVLASLGNIADPDRAFRRECEAELALEAMPRPSALLSEIRGLLDGTAPRSAGRDANGRFYNCGDAARLAKAFAALDSLISTAGILPSEWRK